MTYEVGFVGLGRMGGNMVCNLLDKKRRVVGYDENRAVVKVLEKHGMIGSDSLEGLVDNLGKQKVIWLMIPAKAVDSVMQKLMPLLEKGDIVIDGGNSYFEDSVRRHGELKKKGIYFLDCGTSGGTEGARHGASMMIGGDKGAFKKTEQLFKDLSAENGYAYLGKPGAGHFAKMVHNAIEYGMMGAIAEGMRVMHKVSPEFGIDTKEVARVYANGSIIESKLIDWLLSGMAKEYFESLSGEVPKGETEEEMEKLDKLANMPMLRQALRMRKDARAKPSYEGRIIALLRNQFGQHRAPLKK